MNPLILVGLGITLAGVLTDILKTDNEKSRHVENDTQNVSVKVDPVKKVDDDEGINENNSN